MTFHLTSKTILVIGQAPKKQLSRHQGLGLDLVLAQGQALALDQDLMTQLGKNVAPNHPNRINQPLLHKRMLRFKTRSKHLA